MTNEIAVRNEPSGISTLRAARADFDELLKAAIVPDDRDRFVIRVLTMIAEIRQANVSEATYRLYGRALRAYEPVDLNAAVLHYKQPRNARQQGETAMPDLPGLEGVIQSCRGARIRAAQEEKDAAEEDAARKQYEAEVAAGMHDPDPETRKTMDRLNRVLEEKKSGAMSLSGTLTAGDLRRDADIRRRAVHTRDFARDSVSCAKCSFWNTLTPDDLRKLAETREKRNAAAGLEEGEVAA